MSGLLNKAKEAMGKSSGGSTDAATGGAGGTQSGIEKGISGAGHTRKLHSLSLSLDTFISFPDMTTDDMGVFFASRNRQCDGSLGNGRQV